MYFLTSQKVSKNNTLQDILTAYNQKPYLVLLLTTLKRYEYK